MTDALYFAMAAAYTPSVSVDRMLQLLERLVNENSYSGHPEGLKRVADMLAAELQAIDGISVARFGDHLVASTAAAQGSAVGCVALVGHHDTVFPPGTFEGFVCDGDIARGPGVLDMKSGLVICIEALRTLAARGTSVAARLVIVSDEEVGSPEGGVILEQHLRGAACALVFEAGRAGDAIITTRKGTGGVRAIASGKAAHSGNHHDLGANAIWALAKLIDAAQGLTDYGRGITLNVGTVTGGRSRNTVPDHAEALIDVRFLTVADGEAVVAKLRALADAIDVPGTSIALEGGVARPPLERSAANVALYEEYAACAKAAGLGHGECALVGGGSDASTTAAMGIPSIDGLGPRGSGFHTHDELIEIGSLALRLDALVRFLTGRATVEA
jgi:glutamate carboxypeptidase